MRWSTAAVVVVAACGLQTRDCPPGEAEAAAVAVVETWPEAAVVVDRLDVICKATGEVYGGAVPCIAPWFGSPVARARFVVERELTLECVVHEGQHAALWEATSDPCASHATSCGWSYDDDARTVQAARLVAASPP